MFRETFTTTVNEVSKNANENCKIEEIVENATKDLHHLSVKNAVPRRSIKHTNSHAKSPNRSTTKTASSDLKNRFHDQDFDTNSEERNGALNDRKCPDCGQLWNPSINDSQIEFLCLSPPPPMPEHPPSPICYLEPIPSPYLNHSTSDFESSSEFGSSEDSRGFAELGRSIDSLPAINWSIIDLHKGIWDATDDD